MGIKAKLRPDRQIPPGLWAILSDESTPEPATPEEASAYVAWEFFWSPQRRLEAWAKYRGEVLARWAEMHLGTRPSLWWENNAPEPRRRLGGIGDPASECLAHVEAWDRGIPADWFTEQDAADYKGQTVRNRTHERLGVALNPADPPRFESQAAYLDRLGFLTAGERERLAIEGWPGDEIIVLENEEEIDPTPTQSRKR